MTKLTLSLIVTSILLGIGFHLWSWNQDLQGKSAALRNFQNLQAMKEKLAEEELKISIVYITRDVSPGQLVTDECIVTRPIELSKIPQNAITDYRLGVGRIARLQLTTGQILTFKDLYPRYQGAFGKDIF